MEPWARYLAAHEHWFKATYPTAYADGHLSDPKRPRVSSANGLTQFVINFMNWAGHHAERTNTMGRPVEKKIKRIDGSFNQATATHGTRDVTIGLEWQKGTGTAGSSDIKILFKNVRHKFPIPVQMEIKVGKDKMSEAQIRYADQVNQSGGIYVTVGTVDEFFSVYDYLKRMA